MFRMQVQKRSLAQVALDEEVQRNLFSEQELRTLFDPLDEAHCTLSLLGSEALEHASLLEAVEGDVGRRRGAAGAASSASSTGDFWHPDGGVLGVGDYNKLFTTLQQRKGARRGPGIPRETWRE